MKTRCNRIRTTLAGVLVVFLLAVPVFAVDIIDDPLQIDDQAALLIQTSNSLCWEMHRYHQQQPEFAQAYRSAKEIWSRTGELRDALRAGPVETEVLKRQVNELNEIFDRVEMTLLTWGTGDRSLVATNGGPTQRTVLTQGTEIDLPFVGIRVGRPQVVVTDDGPPQLERRRLHPNSPGSKRGLERKLAAVKVALSDLIEDANVTTAPNSPESGAAAETAPIPKPPAPRPGSDDPQSGNPIPIKKSP